MYIFKDFNLKKKEKLILNYLLLKEWWKNEIPINLFFFSKEKNQLQIHSIPEAKIADDIIINFYFIDNWNYNTNNVNNIIFFFSLALKHFYAYI